MLGYAWLAIRAGLAPPGRSKSPRAPLRGVRVAELPAAAQRWGRFGGGDGVGCGLGGGWDGFSFGCFFVISLIWGGRWVEFGAGSRNWKDGEVDFLRNLKGCCVVMVVLEI